MHTAIEQDSIFFEVQFNLHKDYSKSNSLIARQESFKNNLDSQTQTNISRELTAG